MPDQTQKRIKKPKVSAIEPQQLSLDSLHEQHSKDFSTQKKVTLSNGNFLYIQEKFKPTSIQKLVLDYQNILQQLNQKIVDWTVVKDITFVYYMLLLKYFTNLDLIPADVDKMLIVCEQLIDMGILDEILGSFPVDEMKKLGETIDKINQNSKAIGEQIGELFVSAAMNKQQESIEQESVEA